MLRRKFSVSSTDNDNGCENVDRRTDTPRLGGCKTRPRKAATRRQKQERLVAVGFLAPFMLLLLIFQYVPLLVMARNSFYDYSLLNPGAEKFVGLRNFTDMIEYDDAGKSFGITFLFAFGVVVFVIPIAFALALFLNSKLPARGLVRTMIMLPVVTSSVVIATMWSFLLDPSNGLINGALDIVGVARQPFLTSTTQALPSLIAMTLWQQVGFGAILFLAGLQGVPSELGEAARIDGATRWQVLWNITIPSVANHAVRRGDHDGVFAAGLRAGIPDDPGWTAGKHQPDRLPHLQYRLYHAAGRICLGSLRHLAARRPRHLDGPDGSPAIPLELLT